MMKFCGDRKARLVRVKRSSGEVNRAWWKRALLRTSRNSEPLNSLRGKDYTSKVALTPD